MFYQKYPNIFSKYTTVSWVTQSDNKVDRTPSPHPVPPLGLSLDFFLSKSFLLDTHHRSPGWFHWNFKIVKKYATLWKVREKIDMNSLYMKRRFWDNVKIHYMTTTTEDCKTSSVCKDNWNLVFLFSFIDRKHFV